MSLLTLRLLFALLPLRWALKLVQRRRGALGSGEASLLVANDISRAIGRATRHLPFRIACLHQAFAALLMLRRRNFSATVHFGLARGSNPNGLKAHAWCVCGEVPVIGVECASSFTSIAAFTA